MLLKIEKYRPPTFRRQNSTGRRFDGAPANATELHRYFFFFFFYENRIFQPLNMGMKLFGNVLREEKRRLFGLAQYKKLYSY